MTDNDPRERERDTLPPHEDHRLAELEAANGARLTDAARAVHARQLVESNDSGHKGWALLVEQLQAEMALQRAALLALQHEVSSSRAEIAALREYVDRLEKRLGAAETHHAG